MSTSDRRTLFLLLHAHSHARVSPSPVRFSAFSSFFSSRSFFFPSFFRATLPLGAALSDPRGFKIDRDPCDVILETLKTGFLRILPCKSSLFVYGAISSSIKRTYLPGVWEKNVAEIKRAVKFSTLITTFSSLFSIRGRTNCGISKESQGGGGNDVCIVIFFLSNAA